MVDRYRSDKPDHICLLPRKFGVWCKIPNMTSYDGPVSSSILSEIKAIVKGGRIWRSYDDCAYQHINRVKFGTYEIDLKALDVEIVIDISAFAYSLRGFNDVDFPPIDWYKPFLTGGSRDPS